MLLLFPRVIRESLESTLTPLYLRHPLKWKLLLAFLLRSGHSTPTRLLVPMRALGADSWRIAAALMGRHIVRVCFITLFALASRVPLRLQHHLKVMVYVSLFASLLVVINVVLQSERENKLPKRKVGDWYKLTPK
ncbi:hypothetical protein V6N12_062476 [Hibiscus sabdariffa]|uniref:Uncharacterized protein n=1 Tax=Hibiscus sabdariffa TaxID=183260 RepID=A0ABR2F8Y3_9ROSI